MSVQKRRTGLQPKLRYDEGCQRNYELVPIVDMPYGTTFVNESHSPDGIKCETNTSFALYQKVNVPQSQLKPDCPRNVPFDIFCNSFAVNLRNGNVYNLACRPTAKCGKANGYIVTTNIAFKFNEG